MSTVAERIRPLKAASLLRMGFDVPVGKRALLLADGQPLGLLSSGHYGLESLGRQFGRETSARLRAGRPSLLMLEDREIRLDIRIREEPTPDGHREETRLRLGVRIAEPEVFHAGLRERTDWVGSRWLNEIIQAEVRAADPHPGLDSGTEFEDAVLLQIEPVLTRHGIVVNSLASYRTAMKPEAAATPSADDSASPAESATLTHDVEPLPQRPEYRDRLQQLKVETALAAERARAERLQLDAELEGRARVYDREMEERVRWFVQRQLEATACEDLQIRQTERLAGSRAADPALAFDYDSSADDVGAIATGNAPRTWTGS